MTTMRIDLSKFVDSPQVDFLSGRKFGEDTFRKLNIEKYINDNDRNFKIIIDEKLVKGINDSFIKGFFSDIFRTLKTADKVYEKFDIVGIDHYKRLFHKNFIILERLQ